MQLSYYYLVDIKNKMFLGFSPPGSVLFLDSSVTLWPPFFTPTSFWIFFSFPCVSSSPSDLLVWNKVTLGDYSTCGRSEMLLTADLNLPQDQHTWNSINCRDFWVILTLCPQALTLLEAFHRCAFTDMSFEFLIIWPLFLCKKKIFSKLTNI